MVAKLEKKEEADPSTLLTRFAEELRRALTRILTRGCGTITHAKAAKDAKEDWLLEMGERIAHVPHSRDALSRKAPTGSGQVGAEMQNRKTVSLS